MPHCSSKQLDGFSEKEKNQNRDSPDKSAIINVFFDVWHLLLNYNLIISGQCTAQRKFVSNTQGENIMQNITPRENNYTQ